MRINEISTVDEEWYNPLTWFKKKPRAKNKSADSIAMASPAPSSTDKADAQNNASDEKLIAKKDLTKLLPPVLGIKKAGKQVQDHKNKTQQALDAFKKEMGTEKVKEGDMEADKKNPHAQPFLHLPEWKMLHDIDDKIISAYIKHKSMARAAGRGIKKGLKKLSKLGSKNVSTSWDDDGHATTTTTYNEDDMNYDINQADTRVALDWAGIDGRLYDDILEAFVNEHGEGYYDDWVITANKSGVDESVDSPDTKQKRIAIDTVKNPNKALLGGPSANEAEDILKTKFGYSDNQIAKLKGVDENIKRLKKLSGINEETRLNEFTISDLKGMGIKPTREQFHKLQKINHENGGNITRSDLKKVGINEDGVIVPGVNTTVDVKPGQTEIEAAKFGNGKIKPLMPKGKSNSHILFNLGLAEDK